MTNPKSEENVQQRARDLVRQWQILAGTWGVSMSQVEKDMLAFVQSIDTAAADAEKLEALTKAAEPFASGAPHWGKILAKLSFNGAEELAKYLVEKRAALDLALAVIIPSKPRQEKQNANS